MITRQEMFNRAVVGLRSQGWVQSNIDGPFSGSAQSCAYVKGDLRCAWGWVDRSLTAANNGTVGSLAYAKIGVAAELIDDHLTFAGDLQQLHDLATSTANMEARFRSFGAYHQLTWPEDPVL